MTWAFTGSAAYAWAASGVDDPVEVAESIDLVAGVPDGRIEEELIRTEDQRSDVHFMTLGQPEDRSNHGVLAPTVPAVTKAAP